MIPHLTLRRGGQDYLIIRTAAEFHIIDVNEALTKDKRAAVLEKGCTPAEMQAMGLSGMTIPRSEIQALTVTGCGCQDDVIFYLNKKKLAFWLPEACEQRRVDDFFRGIPRKQYKTRAPVRRGKRADWRLEQQNETMRTRLGIAATVAQGCSAACALGVLVTRRDPMILALAFVVLLVDLGLYLAFPAYFTLMGKKEYQRHGYRAKVRDLGTPMLLCFLVLAVRGWRSYYVFFERSEIGMVAAVCIVLGVLLWRFSRECREHIEYLLLCVAMVAVFGCSCLGHLNFITDFDAPAEPEYHTVIDTQTQRSSRGGRRYDCIVDLGDGEEVRLAITASVLEELEPGDRVPVVISEGGLGLRYAYFDLDTYNYG